MSRQSVAVVGSGVAGMTAAYLLQRHHDVTVFEARDYVGGNADTRDAVLSDGTRVPVDVAFMAYSADTYPTFSKLLAELGVASRTAQVGLDVVCTSCGYTNISKGPTIPPSRGVTPELWHQFTTDLQRFPGDAVQTLESGGAGSVGDFLVANGYSDYFFHHFIYPRSATWFLNDPGGIRVMSLEFLVTALRKYGVLYSKLDPGYRVIDGGSRVYLRRIAEQLTAVHTSTLIRTIERSADDIQLRDAADHLHTFDKAVIAVPAPTALGLLADPTPHQHEILGAFRYASMNVTLHTDMSVYKETHPTPSAICMQVACADENDNFRCTIDASILQTLDTPHPVVLSYNPTRRIAPEEISFQSSYEHAIFTVEACAAQARLPELSDSRLAFAGSYFGSSVHEDGCASGMRAAQALEPRQEWQM